MTRYALLSALTAVVALAASATADATTAPRFKQAAFHATVKGVQTTTWTVNHPSTARCNPASHGSGSERVTFASSRVARVKAVQIFGAPPAWAGSQGPPLLPTRGWVTRQGTLETAPSPPECAVGDGGGGGTTPARDCGRKRIKSLNLELGRDPANRTRISLRSDPVKAPRFENCPSLGEGWPVILAIARGKAVGQTLPDRDLFDRRQGKMILLAHGTSTGGTDGVHYTTKVRWELTLKRLR
jgi:hypothetical protein